MFKINNNFKSKFVVLAGFLCVLHFQALAQDRLSLATSSIHSVIVKALQDVCSHYEATDKTTTCHVYINDVPFDKKDFTRLKIDYNLVLETADKMYDPSGKIHSNINFVSQAFLEGLVLLVGPNADVKEASDFKGKTFLLMDASHDRSLHNILKSMNVSKYKVQTLENSKTLLPDLCKADNTDVILYSGQLDSPTLYSLIADCGYRPYEIKMNDLLNKEYPHYEHAVLEGVDFGADWGSITTISVPYVFVSTKATSNYSVFKFLKVLLEKVVPSHRIYQSVGKKAEAFMVNPTSFRRHQASRQFNKSLGGGQKE